MDDTDRDGVERRGAMRGDTRPAHDVVRERSAPGVGRSDAPVGVFDSGVGGLTVLRELLRELPDERYVYFGDTGNCPYGVRPAGEIIDLSLAGAAFLLERGAKLIVVACNTASSAAIDALRAAYPQIRFIAVVPAVKPAAEMTRVGRVGVIATNSAAQSPYLMGLIEQFASDVETHRIGAQSLVALAEAGKLEGPEVEDEIRQYLAPALAREIDTLALGCTHFPALRGAFERVVGPGVRVIDSGAAVARQTRRVLTEEGLLVAPEAGAADAPRALRSGDEFWRSGETGETFDRVIAALLGSEVRSQFAPEMLYTPATV